MRKAVSVLLFYDGDGKVLIQDRRNLGPERSPWGMFGGSIEEGETPEQALVREIREELCYELSSYEYLGCFEGTHPSGTHVIAHAFIAPMPADGLGAFTLMEGQGMVLCSLEEARRLLVNGEQPAILDAFEKLFS